MKIFLFLGLAAAIAGSVGGYLYLTDPARLTTQPTSTGLVGEFFDRTLTYAGDHEIELEFAAEYRYIGGQKFVLYGSADVEQHFFVEAAPNEALQSIFWLQFEAKKPEMAGRFDYSGSPLRMEIGGFDFFVDTEPGVRSTLLEFGVPGTDGHLARKFAYDRGYRIPQNFAYARLAHLPTEDQRQEMLIIFMDDLVASGYGGRELQPGGPHEALWPELSQSHLSKLRRVMSLREPANNTSNP